jgi:type IV secretion system protein VirB2
MSKRLVFFAVFFLVSWVLFAATRESMPWDDGLTKIQKALSGNTAMTIGIILIIGGGIALAFTEGQALKKLFWVVVGIGIALNAASFAPKIFGTAAGLLIR